MDDLIKNLYTLFDAAWDENMKISFMNYYEYEFRKCGNVWKYCDGRCYQCAITSTTTTAGSTEIRNDTQYSNRTAD